MTSNHTTQAPTTMNSHGEEFRASDATRSAINQIVAEMQNHSVKITDVRGPRSAEARQTFEEFMELAADVRGRPLLYPHVGSGLGNGPLIELMDGSVKFDMITGIGVHFFGHSDPGVVRASLEGATADTVMQGHLMMNREAFDFAKILVDEAQKGGSKLAHAFLCGSGAMANENALKVCYQKHAPASRVIAFAHCFMGRSITMAQIGDSAGGRQGIPLSTLVDYMPFYDHVAAQRMSAGDVSGSTRYIDMCIWHLEQYIQRYPKQHACFIFELVQGEGGFNTALPEFHKAMMEVCRANGIAVWADEVQTFGRTEKMFCFDALGLGEYVDVACVGKMSQVCAAMYTEQYNPQAGLLSGTFLGSSAGLHAGMEILTRLRDGDYYNKADGTKGRIAHHHQLFRDHVAALARKHPEWFGHNHRVHDIAGGFGGMMKMTPFRGEKDPIMKLCRACFDEGLVLFYCGHDPYHVRMLPPLGVMQDEHWPRVFEILERAMGKVASELQLTAPGSPRPMHQPYATS
ncbi:MAG: aminotransferase class III-fold pyridoxal phosphate-dependent enzyme [Phycisphaerales bacterium]